MKKTFKLSLLLVLSGMLAGCNNPVSSSNQDKDYHVLTSAKTISDLSSKSHYCPSKGNVKALVVPVHFSNDPIIMNDTSLLDTAFNGTTHNSITPSWYSVKDFYSQSSYNNLNFEFTITDIFIPSNTSTYYANKENFNGDSYNTQAAQTIYKEALEFLDDSYDLSEYDSDNDGYIDCIYLIYDHEVSFKETTSNLFWWAYTSKNTLEDTFDNKKMSHYIWCSYSFLLKDNEACNTRTLIHETAHLMGADDYYDYNINAGATKGGLAGADLMDNDSGSPCGEHNSYTKGIFGWMNPIIVTTKKEITISLKPLEDKGECIILSNNFNDENGFFQEYFLLEYYTPTKLQELDKPFTKSGIRVLHVCSQLDENNHIKYDNSYSIDSKLISQITSSSGSTYISSSNKRSNATLFTEEKELTSVKYINDEELNYTFKVLSLNEDEASIKITYKG